MYYSELKLFNYYLFNLLIVQLVNWWNGNWYIWNCSKISLFTKPYGQSAFWGIINCSMLQVFNKICSVGGWESTFVHWSDLRFFTPYAVRSGSEGHFSWKFNVWATPDPLYTSYGHLLRSEESAVKNVFKTFPDTVTPFLLISGRSRNTKCTKIYAET